METKVCTKCLNEKPLDLFTKNKNHLDGLEYMCKTCKKEYNFSRKLKEYNTLEENKVCSICNISKKLEEYGKCSSCYLNVKPSCKECRKKEYVNNREHVKNYQELNKERIQQTNKNWREANIEYILDKKEKYRAENKEKINSYRRKYSKDRRIADPIFKLTSDIRTLITGTFKRACNNDFSKVKSTEEILGCSLKEFIEHLQSLFTEGMSLENHGRCKDCWNIDHIHPISEAKTEEEIYKLNNYKNLQPMWSRDNLKKSNKLIK